MKVDPKWSTGHESKKILSSSKEFRDIMMNNTNKSAFIYGNAPTLNLIDDEWVEKNKKDTLTIGINRSFKRMSSDYLLFADRGMETELDRDHPTNVKSIIKISKTKNTEYLRKWAESKMYPKNNVDGLILFRNSLISALDMCVHSHIEKVVLFGVQMDDRSYFYGQHAKKYDPKRAYDTSKLYGYDTHAILKETLQLYFTKYMQIVYTGESKYLTSIGMKHIDIDKVNDWI